MSDKITNIEELKDLVRKFQHEREWERYHTARNLATSIAIEAAELLEHYQWDDGQYEGKLSEVADELADVLIYCLSFADHNKIDISEAVKGKLKKAAIKYPKEATAGPQNLEGYYEIKKDHRSKK